MKWSISTTGWWWIWSYIKMMRLRSVMTSREWFLRMIANIKWSMMLTCISLWRGCCCGCRSTTRRQSDLILSHLVNKSWINAELWIRIETIILLLHLLEGRIVLPLKNGRLLSGYHWTIGAIKLHLTFMMVMILSCTKIYILSLNFEKWCIHSNFKGNIHISVALMIHWMRRVPRIILEALRRSILNEGGSRSLDYLTRC